MIIMSNIIAAIIAAILIIYGLVRAKKTTDDANKNRLLGEQFLAKNKTEQGVETTASGLQYKELEAGTGQSPVKADAVKVHYHGTLVDGTVFDSSVDRGQPIEFGLTQVIPGWTEGLQLMKEGGKGRLFIPAELAYGKRKAGIIPSGSALIFDVELLAVIKR